MWHEVATALCNYETFWRELIVLLTNRVTSVAAPHWIRIRETIPTDYERLAMHNYSMFYYAATAWRAIADDRLRLAAGAYTHPERFFAAMQACVEQAKPLRKLARDILRGVGVDKPAFPKHPEGLYGTVGAYRNAFAHNPVLGRSAHQGRDLLPPKHRLPKGGSPMLWRDAATIPATEMIDGLKLEEDLWQRLAEFLQEFWASLTKEFIDARKYDKFIEDLGLKAFLPIRCVPSGASLAGPVSASGTFVARSDVH